MPFRHFRNDTITDTEMDYIPYNTQLTTEVRTVNNKNVLNTQTAGDNLLDPEKYNRNSNLQSQISQENQIQEQKKMANAILEEEKETGWWGIFLTLAFVRQFTFYLVLITFWIHVYQLKMNLYSGAIGYVSLYFCKIMGTNLVRYSLMKYLPKT